MGILDTLYRPKQIQVGPDNASRQRAFANLLRQDEVQYLFHPASVAFQMSGKTPAEDIADFLLSNLRARTLRYERDPVGRDIWQSPARTLERGGGDREDFAILALSMLHFQQVESYLVTGVVAGNGHAWVEGRDAKGGFLIEATAGVLCRGSRSLFGYDGTRPIEYRADTAITATGYQPLR